MNDLSELEALLSESVIAISHPSHEDNVGLQHLDIVTEGNRVYRFTAEEIDGERSPGGSTFDHYSLAVRTVAEPGSRDERTKLVGTILRVDRILSEEWFGPVVHRLESVGADPRSLFCSKVGSAPPGTRVTQVACGIVLRSNAWRMLVYTHGFPQHVDFTLDAEAIDQFVREYSVDKSATA